jgi:hypothetical protein
MNLPKAVGSARNWRLESAELKESSGSGKGCGFRRSEIVGLHLEQLQSREGRWGIVNWWARKDGYEQCPCRRGVRSLSIPGSGIRESATEKYSDEF